MSQVADGNVTSHRCSVVAAFELVSCYANWVAAHPEVLQSTFGFTIPALENASIAPDAARCFARVCSTSKADIAVRGLAPPAAARRDAGSTPSPLPPATRDEDALPHAKALPRGRRGPWHTCVCVPLWSCRVVLPACLRP